MENEPQSIAQVVGGNGRRIRQEARLTLDDVAVATRWVGLKWGESRVADFEAGRVSPTLPTVIAYVSAMAMLDVDVTPVQLFAGDREVQVTRNHCVELDDLRDWLSGGPIPAPPRPRAAVGVQNPGLPHPESASEERWRARQSMRWHFRHAWDVSGLLAKSGATEERTRRALGFSPEGFASLSFKLWGRTFTEERDHRAGDGANAQTRGRVSRILRAELENEVGHGDDQ